MQRQVMITEHRRVMVDVEQKLCTREAPAPPGQGFEYIHTDVDIWTSGDPPVINQACRNCKCLMQIEEF